MKRLDEIEARAMPGPPECECREVPEHLWTTYAGAVDPTTRFEDNPECPEHGDVSSPKHRPDAEFIAHARADVPALVAALRAVVAIHRPVTVPGEVFGTWGEAKQCEDCEQRWPCNTLDAIRQHLGEDA